MIDINEKQLKKTLKEMDQDHVLEALDSLEGKERENLKNQLDRLDWENFRDLRATLENSPPKKTLDNVEPAPVKQLPESEEELRREKKAAEAGSSALAADRVAALTVAGGQGTRLGFDGPKGAFPIIPEENKSLFHCLAEKIHAARKHYRCRMPWIIMTSPENHGATKEFFEKNRLFGLGADSVLFFKQHLNPILDQKGNLTLKDKDNLLMGPDGHGGVFAALQSSGVCEKLKQENFDLISYFQVDNPLVNLADERFIGYHLLEKADFSCKVIPKRDPFEGLGVAVLDEGRPAIVEYIDLPENMATETDENYRLKYRFGSIAIHMINTEFASEMASSALPWHVAEKNYKTLSTAGEKRETRCYKFEKFVFDCLQHAEGCAFVETKREREFAPVKNAEGKDSPAECRKILMKQTD